MQFTIKVVDGRMVVPYQNEVEDAAIECCGTHHNIYFDNIYLDDAKRWSLSYSHRDKGWVLRYLLNDH